MAKHGRTVTAERRDRPAMTHAPKDQAAAADLLDRQLEHIPDPRLRRSLAQIGAALAAKRDEKPAPKPVRESAEIVQLPLWPEPTRGTPNSFLRGALFAAIQGKERQALKGELLAVQKGDQLRFTGWQLDQSDLDVWEMAATLAQPHPLGNVCHFHIHAFLKALGRNTGKSDSEWLKDSLRRLMAAGVEITSGRYSYGGTLLEFWRDELAGVYVLKLNPNILSLYRAGWTQIDWAIRQKLRRKPLALWLHGWLSSNAENYPVKLDTLRQLSGSRTKELKHFKQNLQKALSDLETAGVISGAAGSINGDLVSFDRTPSLSQQRHLAHKASRNPRKQARDTR